MVRRSEMGHEGRFPSAKLNASCGLTKETFAGLSRNEEDAPKAVLPANPRVLAARACVCLYDLKVGRSSKHITRPSLST